MKFSSRIVLGTAFSLAVLGAPVRAEQDDSAKIVAIVQTFFDAMARRDPAMALKVVLPEGRFSSVREEGGKRVIRSFSNQEDIGKWAKRTDTYLERMWSPEVRLHGHMAVVTAPYDFYLNGTFSHCGIDVFELLETADGWRISGGVYTVQKAACPPSPLGPPEFDAPPGARKPGV